MKAIAMSTGTNNCKNINIYDCDKRNRLRCLFSPEDEFERILSELLPWDIPKSYVESFQYLKNKALNSYPNKAGAILSAVGWSGDETFRFWAAMMAEKGAVLGIFNYHFGEFIELEIVDYYCTWGWERLNCGSKFVKMPINKLIMESAKKADNKKSGILWGVTSFKRYPLFLHYDGCSKNKLEYYEWQKNFYHELSLRFKDIIYARARPNDEMVERIKKFAPNIKLDDYSGDFSGKNSFIESLDSVKLYVCDHLSTTYIQALALNKPTILFWDLARYDISDEASSYFDELNKVGILHYCPMAAAKKIDEIYDDVESWWNGPVLQLARKKFCDMYGVHCEDSLSKWASWLNNFSRNL